MFSLKYKDQIKANKTGWIQSLKKEELLNIVQELQLPNLEENVESLRQTLRDLTKSGRLWTILEPQECESDGEEVEITQEIPIQVKMNTNYGRIEPFNGNNFELFEQQLECIITLNDIPKTKQTPLLITNLTPRVLETLNHLCAPEKPIKKDYSDLITLLENRFAKSTSTVLDRNAFRSRNQTMTESIEEYIIELKKLAKRCEFKDMEDQVKEKFIDGVNKPLIKFELLKNGDVSLEKLIIMARTVEAALKQSNLDQEPAGSSQGTKDLFYTGQRSSVHTSQAKSQLKQQRQSGNKQAQQSTIKKKDMTCFVCGKDNHVRSECSLKNKFCSECGKQGHLFRVCRVRQTKTVNVLGEDDIGEDIQNLFKTEDKADMYSMYSYDFINRKVPPQLINLLVEGQPVVLELDTGSEVSTLTIDDQQKLFPGKAIQKTHISFKNFDQSLSQPIGIVKNINISWNNINKTGDVYIVSNDKPRILGRNWLSIFEQWPLDFNKTLYDQKVNKTCNPVDMVKEKFMEVFTPGWGDFKGECISLKLKTDAKPKFLPVRQVPFALKDKVKNEIKRLLDNKRIEPVKYSEWGTPIVPIMKPDGSVRLCGDYKVTLNPSLETDHYPLPHIDTIFQNLKGGEYYCELDLKEAYLQAPLDPSSQALTVINTEFGIYKYLYLPYGVSTGPGSFQRLMSMKLSHIPNTVVFIDNIYMCGQNLLEMSDILDKVLSVLKDSGLKLKPEKCKFFRKSIEVFGYKIDKEGISIIKENIQPILELPPPENMTMLRSFLGKINYYSRFLKDMATIIAPLYDCTKNEKFKWNADCQHSFDLIKKKLATAQSVSHYDPTLPLILSCDAASEGISAVLSNRGPDNVIKPIAFVSKKLNDREKRYSALDKEAMAIVFGVTKFYNFLYGQQFELETDNTALVRIFGPSKGIPKMAAKRLQHYAIFLSAFSYKIRHIPTNKNPADYLSRMPTKVKQDLDLDKQLGVCVNYIDSSDPNTIDWEVIQKETKKDKLLSTIIRYSYDGWPDVKLIEPQLKPFYIKRNEISIDRGCLFWGHRIIIPHSIRKDVLNELHKSHFGSSRMIDMAKSYFWWPKLNEDIIDITRTCINCLSYRNAPPKANLKPWPVPPSAWYRLHADFLGPLFGKMFLIVVDSYSKWPEVFQMANIASTLSIQKFEQIFLSYGFPIHLVTDNGTSFTSHDFQTYCKKRGINHTFTPPHHPATNGAAERFVETFKSNITKIVESGKSLNYAISIFLSDYRSTPHKSTGVSPARLMLGREVRSRLSLLRPTPIFQDLLLRQSRAVDSVGGSRNLNFQVGENVMTRDFRKGHNPWVKGLIVKESIPNTTYFIDVDGLTWKRHVNQMLKCGQND